MVTISGVASGGDDVCSVVAPGGDDVGGDDVLWLRQVVTMWVVTMLCCCVRW